MCLYMIVILNELCDSHNLSMQITIVVGDKRVIILINYSVEITINMREKLYSISTEDVGARYLSTRYLPDEFDLNYLAYTRR